MVATFKHIIVLCFLCSSIFLGAQVTITETKVEAFKVFDTEDGFPAVTQRAGFTQDSLGFIWLASHVGLYRFDGYHVKAFLSNPEDSTSLHDNYVSKFLKTKTGKLLIGSAYQGIAEYLLKTNTFLQWTPVISDSKFGNIRKLVEDRQGYIWAVTSRGLFKFDPSNKSFYRIDVSPENLTTNKPYEQNSSFYDVILDPEKDELWLAGRFGLYNFDIKAEQYEWMYNDKFYDKQNSTQPRMTGIAFDHKRNCIWLSSRTNGIYQFFPDTEQWFSTMDQNQAGQKSFYLADGIQNLEDEILITAQARMGALFYNKDTHSLENIIFQKGKAPRKFTFGCYASFLDRNGFLISVYEAGVVRSSYPIRPVEKINTPHIALTKIEWKKENIDSLNAIYIKKLAIEKATEILRLNYAAINPPNPNSTFYKYRLLGHDKDWIDNGKSLEALYANLKKGNYQFEVWAQDTVFQWENKVSLISIEVYQAWWKNIWLYILLGLGLIGTLFYFYQKRQKEKQTQLLKESSFEKQIAEVQMQALRSQMNPHFLFNSLNSIKHYVINKDKRDAANYLTKFSKLVRNILQNSNHSLVPLEKELELIKLYMEIECMRFENPFKIEIDIDSQLNTDQVFLPPMLLQPYVENAIWHGLRYKDEGGKITIKVMKNDIGIICSIEDNGIGRKKAAEIRDQNLIQKKSMGTTITKNRIELINKLFNKTAAEETFDLYDENQHPIGTRVLLHIPNFTTKDYHGSKN